MSTETRRLAQKLKQQEQSKDDRDFLYELLDDSLFECFNRKCRNCDQISQCEYKPAKLYRKIKGRLENE